MNFQELLLHIESYGCHYDHLEDNLYWASNCINGHGCEIEDLPDYSDVALCHYCYELRIPTPNHLVEHFDAYKDFRKNSVKIL